ncbi:EamA domain-containing membrane protein RarD [Dysgonomonas macrotermitis]|uniref:EamA domain-containing membrane protein RarD n=1 Tax=Dysgonomonas macrotermitis TaxID=1346286 RepID=A0A1M5IAE8_9BACT|nr:EamA domain-containing membrane protein RarD [Dysgonomonas macrotermitis]
MSQKSLNSAKGIIYALISSGTFGLIPLFSLPLMNEDGVGLPTILFYRFLISTVMMGAVCLVKKENLKVSVKDIITLTWLGTLYAGTALCLIYSYKYIPSGVATTIHFIYPISVSLIMVFFFKERRSVILLLTAILSLLGVALLCWTNNGVINPAGIGIAAITIFSYACYIVGVNKSSVSSMNAEVLTFYILLAGALIFMTFALTTTGIDPVSGVQPWTRLVLLAFLPTVLSDLTLILAIKYAGSTITSILGSMEPLVAVCIGVFYFHEAFGMSSFFGLVLILLSVILVILFGKKPKEI